MPTSILDIEVRDDAFKKFLALYEKYQENLGKMKDVWQQAGAAIDGAADGIKNTAKAAEATAASGTDLADAFAAGSIAAAAIFDAMQKTDATAMHAKSTFADIAAHSKNIAGSIIGATVALGKWAAFTAGAGLLGVGGSLFGLDELAGFAGNQRRASQGLGVSPGEMTSFQTNLSRLVDPSMLGNVQSAQINPNAQWAFSRLGISPSDVANKDPAALSVDVIRAAKSAWQRDKSMPVSERSLSPDFMALQMLGMDYQTWQRIGATSNSEISSDIGKYQAGIGPSGASDSTLKGWQDFENNLQQAGVTIRESLIKGLVDLEKPLENLTKSIETALVGFLGSPNLKIWIDDLASGIQSLAKYLGSPQFIADMKTVAAEMGALGHEMNGFLQWLGLVPTPPNDASAGGLPQPRLSQAGGRFGGGKMRWNFSNVANKYGLTGGALYALADIETGGTFDPNAKNPGSSATGMFQEETAFRKEYNVTDPYNLTQESNAAAMALKNFLGAGFNAEQAILAFHEGRGWVDSQISKYGKDWLTKSDNNQAAKAKLREGQNYLVSYGKVLGVRIDINNQTGAQVQQLANAMIQ